MQLSSRSKWLRPEIDNGFVLIPSVGTGNSIIRKVDVERTIPGKQVVYLDTNNSTNDFDILPFATLTGKN